MSQNLIHDDYVMLLLEEGKIEVNVKDGTVFGSQINLSNERKQIGYKNNKKEICFTFLKNNKSYVFSLARAIWLKENKQIPYGYIVKYFNPEENPYIKNLYLEKRIRNSRNDNSWSEPDLNWLKENYKEFSLDEISKKLNRSVKAIRHKIKHINLDPKENFLKKRAWTEEEDVSLKEMIEKRFSIKKICRILNRTQPSVRLRANRIHGLYRSDKHLKESFDEKNFYNNLKKAIQRNSAGTKCCLCEYKKYNQLHHIDGDRKNNHISNISTLCPTHHVEVERGEHHDKRIYAIWWRKYSNGQNGEINTNEHLF